MLTALALVLPACGGNADGATFSGYVPPSVKHVGNISVAEWKESGTQPFHFHAAPGDVLVVYFGYTNCPDMCPTTMVAVRNAKKRIGDDLAAHVDLAMVTVDPERDLGSNLSKYLGSFAERNHALVPASKEELEAAKDAFQVTSSVTTDATGKVEVTHSASAYVVNPAGDVVVEWPFGMDAQSMAHDLKKLLSGNN
jgi:protein SCO1/2